MSDALPFLLKGLGVTVVITAGGAALALVAAFAAGLARVSRDPILAGLARIYVAIFRGTAALVQIFWFYFVLRFVVDMGPILTGVVVLGLNVGAYGAEVVRGAIRAVPAGQTEAGVALNLSYRQRMRHVIVPQALRMMLPPFGNLLIELLKASALLALIGAHDLTWQGRMWRDAHPAGAVGVFLLLLALYFVLAQVSAFGVHRLEKRLSRGLDREGSR